MEDSTSAPLPPFGIAYDGMAGQYMVLVHKTGTFVHKNSSQDENGNDCDMSDPEMDTRTRRSTRFPGQEDFIDSDILLEQLEHCESEEPESEEEPRPPSKWRKEGTYFHQLNMQPILPAETDIYSDKEDGNVILNRGEKLIHEFTDIEPHEKEFMIHWNRHAWKHRIKLNKMGNLVDVLWQFRVDNVSRLDKSIHLKKDLDFQTQFILFLMCLTELGLITPADYLKCAKFE